MKLLFLRPFSHSDTAALRQGLDAYYELVIPPDYEPHTLVDIVGDTDVCLGPGIFPELIQAAEKLRVLQILGAGVDSVDLGILRGRGVRVGNSHSNAPYVAEHAIALLFALLKKTHSHDAMMRQGVWFRPSGRAEDDFYMSDTIIGKRIGLVGCGQIGRHIARFLSGFEVELLAYRRQAQDLEIAGFAPGAIQVTSLADVLGRSDAVFVCLPLTGDTRGLLGAEQIRKLGKEAYLVNVSRGDIVDQEALFGALSRAEFAGAGIDVWWADNVEVEGKRYPYRDYPFHELENVVMSPYRAGYLRYDSPHLREVILNLQRFATDGELSNEVDLDQGY